MRTGRMVLQVIGAGAALLAAGCTASRPLSAWLPELGAPLDKVVVGVAAGGSAAARKVLSGGMSTKLAKAGMTVRDLGRATNYDSPASAYGASSELGVDMLVVLWGEAHQVDKFGNFHSYEARCRGKILDPVEGGEFGSKDVKARGERELTVIDAERSALEAAGKELTEHLAAELVSKIESAGCAVRVVVRGVRSTAEVDRIKGHLRGKPGVIKAESTSWSEDTRTARMLVRTHPSTKANLAAYLETVPGIAIKVTDVRERDLSGKRVEE